MVINLVVFIFKSSVILEISKCALRSTTLILFAVLLSSCSKINNPLFYIETNENKAIMLYNKGIDEIQKKETNYLSAAKYFEESLSFNPQYYDSVKLAAMVYSILAASGMEMAHKDQSKITATYSEKAEYYGKKLLAFNASDVNGLWILGVRCFRNERYLGAVEYFEKLVSLPLSASKKDHYNSCKVQALVYDMLSLSYWFSRDAKNALKYRNIVAKHPCDINREGSVLLQQLLVKYIDQVERESVIASNSTFSYVEKSYISSNTRESKDFERTVKKSYSLSENQGNLVDKAKVPSRNIDDSTPTRENSQKLMMELDEIMKVKVKHDISKKLF